MVGYVTKKSDLGLPVPDQGQHLRPLTPECQCSLLGPHHLDFILPFVPCHSLSHRTETREHGAHHTSLYFWPELAPFPRLFHQGSKTRLPGLSAHSSSITQHPREESGRGPLQVVGSGHQPQRRGLPGAERHAWLPNPVWPQWMLSGGVSWMSQDTHVHRLGFREGHRHLWLARIPSCLKAEAPSLPEYPSHREPRTGSECLGGEMGGGMPTPLSSAPHTLGSYRQSGVSAQPAGQ